MQFFCQKGVFRANFLEFLTILPKKWGNADRRRGVSGGVAGGEGRDCYILFIKVRARARDIEMFPVCDRSIGVVLAGCRADRAGLSEISHGGNNCIPRREMEFPTEGTFGLLEGETAGGDLP